MTRGSDKHGAAHDDEMEKEIEGMLRGNHPTRAEESHDSEPPADDDLSVTEHVQRPERPAGNE